MLPRGIYYLPERGWKMGSYNQIAAMVKEKTGRAMQTKDRERVNKKTGEQLRISMAVSRATAENDKTIRQLQGALKSSRYILNIIADILYKASEVFRRAIEAIIHFATERHKSIFSPSEAADIKSVMQSYGETTMSFRLRIGC